MKRNFYFDIEPYHFKVSTILKEGKTLISKIQFSLKPLSSSTEETCETIELLKQALSDLFSKKEPNFPLELLDLDSLTNKEQTVLKTLFESKIGETLSYGELAEKSGFHKKYARFIGNVMAKNPFPLIIPCHRVLKSDGSLGNYSGAEGPSTKQALLKAEVQN